MRWKIRLISSHSLWRLNAALAEDEQFFFFSPFSRCSPYFLVLIEFSSIISLKLNRNLNCMDQLFLCVRAAAAAPRRRNKKMGLSAGWWWRFYSHRKDLEIGKHKRRIFQRLLSCCVAISPLFISSSTNSPLKRVKNFWIFINCRAKETVENWNKLHRIGLLPHSEKKLSRQDLKSPCHANGNPHR